MLGSWSSCSILQAAWLPGCLFFPCLNNLSSQLILTSVCIFSTSSPFLPPSHIYFTCSLKQPHSSLAPSASLFAGSMGPHYWESLSALHAFGLTLWSYPTIFEPQHTRWYRKEDNSCLLWERTSNLRCPELRFLARVLSIPKAPPRCWKFFNAFKGQC